MFQLSRLLRRARAVTPRTFEFELPDTMLDEQVIVDFRGEVIGSDKLTLRVHEVRIMPMDPRAGDGQSSWAPFGYEPIMTFDVDTVYLGRKNAGTAD